MASVIQSAGRCATLDERVAAVLDIDPATAESFADKVVRRGALTAWEGDFDWRAEMFLVIRAQRDEILRLRRDSPAVDAAPRPALKSPVGPFIDQIAGKKRTVAAVSGRLLEESVELALACGMNAGAIFGHVADALHNQALKASRLASKTIFPAQLVANSEMKEIADEGADVGLILDDLAHVAGFDLEAAKAAKWAAFTQKTFRVSDAGTIYAVKPHIQE